MTQAIPHPCQAPGCPNLKLPGRGSRYCQEHRDFTVYMQRRKAESIIPKICLKPECGEPRLSGHGQKYCVRHSADAGKSSPAYRKRASIMQVRRIRERRLGVTHEEFTARLDAQGGICAICGGDNGERQLSIDHDHETGTVRGLLCDRCNPMLGYARDSIAVLQAAIEYLKRNKGSGIESASVHVVSLDL